MSEKARDGVVNKIGQNLIYVKNLVVSDGMQFTSGGAAIRR